MTGISLIYAADSLDRYGLRNRAPWPDKPWRTLSGIAARTSLPQRVEESPLSRFAMIILISARKR